MKNCSIQVMFVSGLMTLCAHADRFVVEPGTPGGTNAGLFNTWTNAATNIQLAINAAGAGETIWISNGTYTAEGGVVTTGTEDVGTNMVYINKGIILSGWTTNPANHIIRGAYPAFSNRCVWVNHADAIIRNLTVSNGYAYTGGGVFIRGGVISNCVIAGNTAYSDHWYRGGGGVYSYLNGDILNCSIFGNRVSDGGGGGIAISRSAGMIVGCHVYTNNANSGGGISVYRSGVVTNCIIEYNHAAQDGGGLRNIAASLETGEAFDSIIRHNHAGRDGGGLWSGGKVTGYKLQKLRIYSNISGRNGGGVYFEYPRNVTYSIITDNIAATNGGGIYYFSVHDEPKNLEYNLIRGNIASNIGGGVYTLYAGHLLSMRNCEISGNQAVTNVGGGLYLNAIEGVVESCTIAGNSAGVTGGGVYAIDACPMTNSVIHGNSQTNGVTDDLFLSNAAASNAVGYCLTSISLPGPGNRTGDPLFVDADAGNYRLSSGSPAINAGFYYDWMGSSLDMDGRQRLDRLTGVVDMGCYEYLFLGTFYFVR